MPKTVPGAAAIAATAAGCSTWADLAAAMRGCTGCPELVGTRASVVAGDVPAGGRPRLALVGEAPGAAEDREGRPFVGRAGRLLDELIGRAGLDRGEMAVLNVLRCRPPGNRAPRPDEVARCRGWLDRTLDLVGAPVVCALGSTAAAWFLGRGTRLAAARGTVHHVDGRQVVVTYHPSAAIRFGPAGAPLAALRADLALVAALLGAGRATGGSGG